MHDARTIPLLPMIPDPHTVREQLAKNIRESQLLRQLLRVSERAAEERKKQLKAEVVNA